MSRCYALTKDNKPCRNYGIVLEDSEDILYAPTCHHHPNFFDTWCKRLPRLGYSIESYPQIRYHHVRRVLEEGIVDVKKEDIERLPEGRNYTHLILLCAKHVEGFKRSWNPAVFDRCVRNIWWQVFAVGPVNVSSQDLVALLKCYDGPLVKSFYTILTKFPENEYQEPWETEWLRVTEVLLENSYLKWDPDLLNSENFQMLKEKTKRFPRLQTLLEDGTLETKIRSVKKNFYKRQKETMDSVKEELVMVTWHPDRFVEWCMDWEEKEWLQKEF